MGKKWAMPPRTMKPPATRLTMRLQGEKTGQYAIAVAGRSRRRNVSQRACGTDNASEKSMMGDRVCEKWCLRRVLLFATELSRGREILLGTVATAAWPGSLELRSRRRLGRETLGSVVTSPSSVCMEVHSALNSPCTSDRKCLPWLQHTALKIWVPTHT